MAEKENKSEFDIYGTSASGNFKVINSIGVPHPYCITSKHVCIASDNFNGILNENAIREAEEEGAICDTCRILVKTGKQDAILSFDEHKTALIIECKKDVKIDKEAQNECTKWLLKIKDLAEKNNIEGFAFVLKNDEK